MANYVESNLLAFQGRMQAGMAAHEVRELETEILPYALKNTRFYEEANLYDIRSIKKSVQRPVYAYQFNRIASTGGTGMTTFPTGTLGSAVQIPLTFVSFSETFQTFNVSGLDNVFQFAQIFDNQAKQAMRNIRTRIRQWMVNNLYTNRTATLPLGLTSVQGANFNAATNAYEITNSTPWATMTSVMRQASYGADMFNVLSDSIGYQNYLYGSNQATMNATNLNYQFAKTPTMPGKGYFDNIWEEPNLGTTVPIQPGYTNGTTLVMPQNAFCMVPWMPEPYYGAGYSKSFDQYVGGYGTIGDDKYADLQYQIFGWNNQSDTSGSNGYPQSQTQNWQIGWTAAYLTAYLSNAGETPVYQFAIMP